MPIVPSRKSMSSSGAARNINCGVLGHIDSGKTALCRALHQIASTASMDKNPQSRERGITLDLGFSSFCLPPYGCDDLPTQITLVDCPGHSSLIRTVLAGSRIIDIALLVVDAVKGFEPQTAECLVIAEIITPLLLVVVNKSDLVSEADMVRIENRIRNTLRRTTFGLDTPIVFVSATRHEGLDQLVPTLTVLSRLVPERNPTGPLHIAYDHCFHIKGHGTVFSGTVLSGTVNKGQSVTLSGYDVSGEVRSIQVFRSSVDSASQGDRVGICIPKISSDDKERGDIVDTGVVPVRTHVLVCLIQKIKYFKLSLTTGKFHVTIGNTNTVANVILLRPRDGPPESATTSSEHPRESLITSLSREALVWSESLNSSHTSFELINDEQSLTNPELCLLVFSKEITVTHDAMVVGSKLDLEESFTGCRLGFYGRILSINTCKLVEKVTKFITRSGEIDRVYSAEDRVYLLRNITTGTGDASRFIGMAIVHSKTGERGVIEGTFGKVGLLRARFQSDSPLFSKLDDVVLTIEKHALGTLIESQR
jgi:selenocysteine-specific elongation factor